MRISVASASAFSISLGSIVAFAPASQAQVACTSDATIGMTASTLEGGTICELIFLPLGSSPQAVNWTPPEGVGKVSALIVGGGSSAVEEGFPNDYSAGGAGEVVYVDDVDLGSGPLTLTVGTGEPTSLGTWNMDSDGYSELVGGQNYLANSGFDAGNGAGAARGGRSGGGQSGGFAQNGTYTSASGGGQTGQGSAQSDLSADLPGGAGTTVQALGADPELWPATFTTEFGVGGSYVTDVSRLLQTSNVLGLGYGGSIWAQNDSSQLQPGASGSIRLRYKIGSPAPQPPQIPAVSYEGPLNLQTQAGPLCSGSDVILSGQRLSTIEQVQVGARVTTFELLENGNLTYSLKDIAPGPYQVRLSVPASSLVLTKQITVQSCGASTVVTESLGKVNVGSFNGKLVVYALNLDGSRITWKVGGIWGQQLAVGNTLNRFDRLTPRMGVTVKVDIYVDGVKRLTKNVLTR